MLLIAWLSGANPIDVLTGGSSSDDQSGQIGTPTDQQGMFVATVLADTEDFWTKSFAAMGKTYTPPTLVLFRFDLVRCGTASEASGPFYCPRRTRRFTSTSPSTDELQKPDFTLPASSLESM